LVKPKQIVIAGRKENPDTKALLEEVHRHYVPDKVLLLAEGETGLSLTFPFLKNTVMISGKATAYVCENYACKLPTNDPRELRKQLSSR